jgi:hypothetical protein
MFRQAPLDEVFKARRVTVFIRNEVDRNLSRRAFGGSY